MADYGVRVEEKDGVGVVVLDRPEKRNAMDETMWSSLEEAAKKLAARPPRAVVVTGAGDRAFCAGMDVNPENPQVSGLIKAMEKHDPAPVRKLIDRLSAAVRSLVSLPVPVIAAINGDAHGGGAELAVQCDLRVMDARAKIRFSEVRLGLMPDWGGVPALARLAGTSVAADLILTARAVDAAEALSLGLVNRVSEPGDALAHALCLAREIARNGPLAVRHALSVIRRIPDLSLQQALDLEAQTASELIAAGECAHGVAAFLEKKEPVFPEPED
ncbi:MAG: enoyl-CoA hydratase/isomerase family protein [Deltaproteobacteria bacterium]|nr:enoyl-CoA hydratase/isomerase family protein [Deltaproteobacteria bacterium]